MYSYFHVFLTIHTFINPNHYFVYMYLPFITSAEMHTVNEYSNLILRTSDADGTRWYQKGQVSHSVSIK